MTGCAGRGWTRPSSGPQSLSRLSPRRVLGTVPSQKLNSLDTAPITVFPVVDDCVTDNRQSPAISPKMTWSSSPTAFFRSVAVHNARSALTLLVCGALRHDQIDKAPKCRLLSRTAYWPSMRRRRRVSRGTLPLPNWKRTFGILLRCLCSRLFSKA